MLQTAVRPAATFRVPFDRLLGVAAVGSFAWLLLADRVPPLVVLLLELYLSF